MNLTYQNYHVAGYKVGNGKTPVFLCHGAGLDNAMLSWKEVMQLFGPKYTVYAFDYPGYGKSDRLPDGKAVPFYPFYINLIEEIRKQIGVEKIVIAGLSFGGSLAIGYTLAHPDRVLALIATDAWGLTAKMPWQKITWWYLQHTHLTCKMYRMLGRHRSWAKWSITSGLFGDKTKVSEELVDALVELCNAPDAGVSMEDFQRNSVTKTGTYPYYGKKLTALTMPVLFVNGDKDAGVPLKDAKAASELVKGSELYVMKGCKHWAQKERPGEYVKAVTNFLEKRI